MLTPKQEKFIQELVKGKSQREAYQAAYNASNMKPATIDKKASLLLKKGEIRGRYKKLMQAATEASDDNAVSIRKTIIDTSMAIVKANLGDILELKRGRGGRYLVAIPKGDLTKFDMRAVKKYRYDNNGHLMLELYDKQPAVDTLMKIYGICTEDEKEEIKVILQGTEGYDK